MRSLLKPATLLTPGRSWTCPQCLGRWRSSRTRFLSNPAITPKPPKATPYRNPRRKYAIAAGFGLVGALATVASWDELRHGYVAAKRTGRVVFTLVICMVE